MNGVFRIEKFKANGFILLFCLSSKDFIVLILVRQVHFLHVQQVSIGFCLVGKNLWVYSCF